jgi:hypothetical protein
MKSAAQKTYGSFYRKDKIMKKKSSKHTFIIDLEKLNTLNSEGCVACGKKFNLGDTAVMACGSWDGPPKVIHESEAVFDPKTNTHVERQCYADRT